MFTESPYVPQSTLQSTGFLFSKEKEVGTGDCGGDCGVRYEEDQWHKDLVSVFVHV